ncbi:MAG: hypothetical protein H0X40_07900 [Chthoniobacterales bacterium]|nr:hypothetical protein [Chthoniobacterales bacterium]
MDNFDDNELSSEIGKLLRLKKFEQPPPAYFEDFLHEFHRRQRDELLREPLWSVIWHRLSDSFFRFSIPSLTSYPAALAAVLVCAAVVSLKIYQASPQTESFAVNAEAVVPMATAPADHFTLSSPVTLASRSLGPDLSRQIDESAYTHRAQTPPRYVLDRLPVSYEPSFNF